MSNNNLQNVSCLPADPFNHATKKKPLQCHQIEISINRQNGFNMFFLTQNLLLSALKNCNKSIHLSLRQRPWCCFRAGDSDSALSLAFNGSRGVPVPKLRARGPMTCGCFGGGLDVDGWFLNMIFLFRSDTRVIRVDENIMGFCG